MFLKIISDGKEKLNKIPVNNEKFARLSAKSPRKPFKSPELNSPCLPIVWGEVFILKSYYVCFKVNFNF